MVTYTLIARPAMGECLTGVQLHVTDYVKKPSCKVTLETEASCEIDKSLQDITGSEKNSFSTDTTWKSVNMTKQSVLAHD